MGNTVTNDGTSVVGFKEEPDDIFEPRVDNVQLENLSARTRALLSLSGGRDTGIAADETHTGNLSDLYSVLDVTPVEASFMRQFNSSSMHSSHQVKPHTKHNNTFSSLSQNPKEELLANGVQTQNIESDKNDLLDEVETINPVKEIAWLVVNQEKFVTGYVTITPQLLVFEPHTTDEHVKKDGLLAYQFCIDARDITGCGEVGHVTRVINTKQLDENTGKEKRARRGGGMTYLQIFWQKEKDRRRSRRKNTNQTLFLVRKDKIEALVNTLKKVLDDISSIVLKSTIRGRRQIVASMTTGPVISHTGHLSPTKLFKIATNARGGSPSPPPTITVRNSIGSAEFVDNAKGVFSSSIDGRKLPGNNDTVSISENENSKNKDDEKWSSHNNPPKKDVGNRQIHAPMFIGGRSRILSITDSLDIEGALPHGQRGYNWQLSYSSSTHGLNWITFHRCVEPAGPSLLIIRTTQGEIIGCYASEQWVPNGKYAGTGECFAFKCKPGPFQTYTWSFKDPYFMMCTANSLVMGGGGGFAIRLDKHFKGYSTSCDTFKTIGPITKAENFEVFDLEVFCFVSGNSIDETKRPANFDWSRHS